MIAICSMVDVVIDDCFSRTSVEDRGIFESGKFIFCPLSSTGRGDRFSRGGESKKKTLDLFLLSGDEDDWRDDVCDVVGVTVVIS